MPVDKNIRLDGKRPTLKDVAERAGVSWSTVSNVIHDHQYIRESTRLRVEAAIAEIGYQPSLAGRQLRRGRSDLLAFAVPEIASPYFAHLAEAIIAEAERLTYTVLVDVTGGNIERERAVAEGYSSRGIEGVIFNPLRLDIPRILQLKRDTPMVLLGEHVQRGQIDHVAIDNVVSAREATDHLISIGRRKIAFLGYQPQGPTGTGDLRLKGYQQGLSAAGFPIDPSLILNARSFTREEGERAACQLLPRIAEVDAIVCAADLLAIGAMKCFRREGINVPLDVALLGWDNTPDGQFSSPELTTVAPDVAAIARVAIQTVLARINGLGHPPNDITVPHQLIVRESTAGKLTHSFVSEKTAATGYLSSET